MSTSRDNEEIRRLFNEHVPEIANGAVEIMGIAREPRRRVMVAVHSPDANICPVSSCTGVRGKRLKSIASALPGDLVEIVRWSDSVEDFIRHLLSPAKVGKITFDTAAHQATIEVSTESLETLAADRGLRLQLASRLAGWNLTAR